MDYTALYLKGGSSLLDEENQLSFFFSQMTTLNKDACDTGETGQTDKAGTIFLSSCRTYWNKDIQEQWRLTGN